MHKDSKKIEFQVEAEAEGRVLQNYLEGTRGISAKAIKRLKYQGEVLLNGRRTLLNAKLHEGDRILLVYPPQTNSPYVLPEQIPLQIMYEDEEVLVVVKQPYLCVHPTKGHPEGTLANGVLYHWQTKGEKAHLHIVNRLDKDTSGLILIAKSTYAAQQLFNQQKLGRIQRAYIALVSGWVEGEEGTIDLPIGRVPGRTTKRLITPEGQHAVTHYQVRERLLDRVEKAVYTLLDISLETGRTHQIRIHFSHLGHPLVGDTFYGGNATDNMGRQFLHAYHLAFEHPVTRERKEFNQELPADLASYLANLEAYHD